MHIFVQTQTALYLSDKQTYLSVMIVLIFIFVTVIAPRIYGSLTITDHKYHLMHYTKVMSKEHFTTRRPLVTVLPLAEEDYSNKGAGYLIEELHTSGRWPKQLYNVSYKINGNV
jgi:hypothetical protein